MSRGNDPLLTSAMDGGEWSVSRPGSFTPRGEQNIYGAGDWPVGHIIYYYYYHHHHLLYAVYLHLHS